MKFFRKKRFWVLIIGLLIIGGLIWKFSQKPATTYVTAKAVMGNINQTVEVTGSVKSAEEVNLNFTTAGKVANVAVKTGDNVKAGQFLASLVSSDVGSQVNDARAFLDIARSNYEQLLAGASQPDIAVVQQQVATAQVAYQKSLDDLFGLEKTRDLDLKNLIAETNSTSNNKLATVQYALDVVYDAAVDSGNQTDLSVTNTSLLIATREGYQITHNNYLSAVNLVNNTNQILKYDDVLIAANKVETVLEQTSANINNCYDLMVSTIVNSVYTVTVISNFKTSLSAQSTNVTAAISSMHSNVADLQNTNLSYETKIIAAKNDIDAKLASLNLAKAQLDLKTAKPRDFEINSVAASIRRAQATLDMYLGQLNKTIINAPFDGVVTDVNYKKGEQTSATEPAIILIGISDKEIKVDVPESDIAKVKLGDAVDITLDAFSSDEKFNGQVMFIDPASTDINGVIYYKVKVNFVDNDNRIKAGMTADLTINTDKRDNVLTIPSRAVIYRDNVKYVQLLANGKLVEKPVATGLRGDDGMIEVISGVKAGESVVTFINSPK